MDRAGGGLSYRMARKPVGPQPDGSHCSDSAARLAPLAWAHDHAVAHPDDHGARPHRSDQPGRGLRAVLGDQVHHRLPLGSRRLVVRQAAGGVHRRSARGGRVACMGDPFPLAGRAQPAGGPGSGPGRRAGLPESGRRSDRESARRARPRAGGGAAVHRQCRRDHPGATPRGVGQERGAGRWRGSPDSAVRRSRVRRVGRTGVQLRRRGPPGSRDRGGLGLRLDRSGPPYRTGRTPGPGVRPLAARRRPGGRRHRRDLPDGFGPERTTGPYQR